MRRQRISFLILGMILGAILRVGVAYAVNFTIVLTQPEVDIATWEWNQEDPSHVRWATAQLFGAAKVSAMISDWKVRRIGKREMILGTPTGYFCTNTWAGLSGATQQSICTSTLGDIALCTPCDAAGN